MFAKSLLAAALVSVSALAAAPAAQADPSIGFSFGITSPGYGFYDGGYDGYDGYGYDGAPYPYYLHHRHHHHHDWGYPGPVSYGLSCGAASAVVRAHGFRGVHAVDCSAPVYGYEAWKHGELFRVGVSTRGAIVAVDPLY
ncbi:MAG: hypothetical protein KGO53_11100 [Alphaproteobacteria bacterium]|nr:hypothetical protein [Alphaproteobacteria bacterium]